VWQEILEKQLRNEKPKECHELETAEDN
jgi:hypothetical protein